MRRPARFWHLRCLWRCLGLAVAGAFIVVAVAFGASCAGGNAHRRAAEAAAAAGRSAEVLVELELAVAEDPGDPSTWVALGRAQLAAGRPGAALRSFIKAERGGRDTAERVDLLARRAEERVALGDVDRWRDLEAVVHAEASRAPALRGARIAALAEAAVERVRAGDEAGARALAARVRSLGGLVGQPAPSPPDLGTLTLAAFGAWLRGEADRFPEAGLARALASAPPAELPAWLVPVRAELLAQVPTAAELAAAGAAPAPSDARLVVAFVEARAAHKPLGVALRGSEPQGDLLLSALARATIARELGDEPAAATALASARRYPGGELALARRGEVETLAEGMATTDALRRYRAMAAILAGDTPPARSDSDPDPPASALGPRARRALPPARAGCRRDDGAFLALRDAVARDLGLATRIARVYVDGELALGCRAADAAHELGRGDPRLAIAFVDELVAEEPEAGAPHALLARLLARAGDPDRARIELDTAEALAARRGVTSALVSADLRLAGTSVPAIGAARQALALSVGPDRGAALEAIVLSCLAAGREDDAERAFALIRAELPGALVCDAAGRVAEELGVRPAPAWLPAPPPPPPGSVAALILAAARSARERAHVERALLLIGLADDGPRGARALLGVAKLLEADGRGDLARAARAEAALLSEPNP